MKQLRNIAILSVAGVAMLVIIWQAWTSSAQTQAQPAFTLQTTTNDTKTLQQYRGSGVVINFWATYCPPCEREMPVLQQAYNKYENEGVHIIAINVAEPLKVILPFIQQRQITFPVLLDRRGQVADQYGVINLPMTFFIDANGQVTKQISGELTQQLLDTHIDQIIP